MDLKTLNDIFESRLFRIPDYQRGYAWRSDADKEVVAFWNDLINLPIGKSHFTGSLTLQSMTDDEKRSLEIDWILNSGYTPWFVVDGQQRLTTITILLQCIYEFLLEQKKITEFFINDSIERGTDKIREKYICIENKRLLSTTYFLGYLNNPVSENYLKKYVFNDNRAVVNEQSYYTLNIRNAKIFFKNQIQQLYTENNNSIEVIECLFKKVTLQLKFDLIEVGPNDDFNIFVAFETINNRGKQLTNLEKLKNRLVYLTTLDTISLVPGKISPIRKTINEAWGEIYRQLGRNFKKSSNGKVSVLDDDEFLKTHWILYFQYSRKTGNDYIDYLLGKKFTVQNVMKNLATTESTQEYVKDEEDAEIEELHDLTDEKETTIANGLSQKEIQEYVINLRDTAEMWYYTWFPQDAKEKLDNDEILWIERINRIGIAYFRPLITALLFKVIKENKVDHAKNIEALKAIERFIFITFRIQTTRSHFGSSEFNVAARELHQGKKTVDEILKMLNERIARSFEKSEDGQEYFKTQYMQVMVNKLFEQKDDERTGYYRWSTIRYFLFEYNADLVKQCHGQCELKWDSFKQDEKDKISIEHIFPHKAEGYWAIQFKNVDKEKWPIYEGSLGNLLLLSQKINAGLQNDDFDTKKNGRQSEDEKKNRIGYKKGSAAEQIVGEYPDWTPQAIEELGKKMIEFLERRWGVRIKTELEKKKLLLPGIY